MTIPVARSIKETDRKLRNLLELLFDSSESLVFEDVLIAFAECITIDLDCFLYIKERRWFSDPPLSPQSDFLKFSYLSFEFTNRVMSRFTNRHDLERREAQLISERYKRLDSRLCTILYKSPRDSGGLSRILNLIKRIFVAFYKNCGAHSHFLESVTRRFIREFYSLNESNPTLTDVVRYIRNNSGINVSVWNQKDEMYFHQNDDLSSLLTYEASSNMDHEILFLDQKFRSDLKTSVTRKNQTYGKSHTSNVYYVIRTFSDDYFIGETGTSNFKTQQKAVAIYSAKSQPLSLDTVQHASRLIGTYLRTTQEMQYHSIILNGTQQCALMEEKLSTTPAENKSTLMGEFKKLLEPLLTDVAKHTRAEFACMRLFEPFGNLLIPIAVGSDLPHETPIAISIKDKDSSISATAFVSDQIVDQWHPTKLRQELAQAITDTPSDKPKLKAALKSRIQLRDSLGRAESAVVALPIRKVILLLALLSFPPAKQADSRMKRVSSNSLRPYAVTCFEDSNSPTTEGGWLACRFYMRPGTGSRLSSVTCVKQTTRLLRNLLS